MANVNRSIVPDIVCEFLEIATHSILHARKLYPESIFERKHKYGVVVYKSIHPDLNNYISECIKTAYHLTKTNQLKKFVICFAKDNIIEEKYVFSLISLIPSIEKDPYLLDLEKHFRVFCLRLNSRIGYLEPLNSDNKFSIQIHTTEIGSVDCMDNPVFENFPWIYTEENSIFQSEIVPLQTLESDFLKLQCYIQTKLLQ